MTDIISDEHWINIGINNTSHTAIINQGDSNE
jgi:hypothetical protein